MRGATRLLKAIISQEERWQERSRLCPLLASRPGEGPSNLSLTKESILAQYASSSMCLPLLPGSDINAVATPVMAVVVVVVVVIVVVVVDVVGDWSVPNNSQSTSAIRCWTLVRASDPRIHVLRKSSLVLSARSVRRSCFLKTGDARSSLVIIY